MAYEQVSGTNPRRLPTYRNMFSKNWLVGENAKLQVIVNDASTVDVAQVNITQADVDALGAGQELRAVLRIDLVPFTPPPVE